MTNTITHPNRFGIAMGMGHRQERMEEVTF